MANLEHLGIPKQGIKQKINWRIRFCASVFWDQLKKSVLFRVLTALSVISTVLTFIGLFVTIQVPHPKLSVRSWVEVALAIVILLLILMVEALTRYYFTILKENSVKLHKVQIFSQLLGRGQLLQVLNDTNDITKGNPSLFPEVTNKVAAGSLTDLAQTSMWSGLNWWTTDIEREVRSLGQETWLKFVDSYPFQPPTEKHGLSKWIIAQNSKLVKIMEDLREGRPPLTEKSASTN